MNQEEHMDWEHISKILQQVGLVLEREYLPKFFDSISIDIDATYDLFHHMQIKYRSQTDTSDVPSLEELRNSTKILEKESLKKSAMIGAFGGLGGFLTLIPESAGNLIHTYRCTQRLCLMYGLDITDHQKIFGLMIMSQSPKQLTNTTEPSNPTTEGVKAIQKLAKHLAYSAAIKRVRKFIPGIGSGFGAWHGYKEMASYLENLVFNLENIHIQNHSAYIEAEEISRQKFR